MDDLVKANMVVVRRTDFWIEVEIRTDILFPSASAQLSPSAVGVIERLGAALAPFPNPIRVEGHTDNRPIKTVAFFSNWELSAARAGSVVRVLASRGVTPERLAVIGYGENRPTHPNDTAEGRNANRRVVIVILSTDIGNRPRCRRERPLPMETGRATLATDTIGAAPFRAHLPPYWIHDRVPLRGHRGAGRPARNRSLDVRALSRSAARTLQPNVVRTDSFFVPHVPF